MNEVYIVCNGDVESHAIVTVFKKFEDAEACAEKRAYGSLWKRIDTSFEDAEVALWICDRNFSFISIEKWSVL